MPRDARRRFTVLDMMILIGFTAIGFALARVSRLGVVTLWDTGVEGYLRVLTGSVALFATMPTLAIIPLRLRRPRPSRARLMCQPGMVAACAAAVALAVGIVSWSLIPSHLRLSIQNPVADFWLGQGEQVGFSVAASWLGLVLIRRWRAEPSWIDRLGRAIGGFWLAVFFALGPFTRWLFVLFS